MKNSIHDVKKRFVNLQKQIELICKQVGRDSASVLLLAVSKKQPLNKLKEIAFNKGYGQEHFGENYTQELIERQKTFSSFKMAFYWSITV